MACSFECVNEKRVYSLLGEWCRRGERVIMTMRNYYEVAKDLKISYYSGERAKQNLELVGGNEDLFWDYLSLSHLICNGIDMKKSPGSALLVLGTKFINHSAVTYQMLMQSMVDEYYIMLRQSCEVFWLAEYFIKHPDKEEGWMSARTNYIAPKDVRASLDVDSRMQKIYGFLSSNAHPKTISINNILTDQGLAVFGNYNSDFTNTAYYLLLKHIDEFVVVYLDVLIKQNKIDLIELQQKKKTGSSISEIEEVCILAVGQFSILSEKLADIESDFRGSK